GGERPGEAPQCSGHHLLSIDAVERLVRMVDRALLQPDLCQAQERLGVIDRPPARALAVDPAEDRVDAAVELDISRVFPPATEAEDTLVVILARAPKIELEGLDIEDGRLHGWGGRRSG